MKNLFYTAFLILFPLFLTAQSPSGCIAPEELPSVKNRLQHNVSQGAGATQRALSYVPLRFHLVADQSGAGRSKMRLILNQLCALNEAYLPGDIQFYLHGADLVGTSISNDLVNEDPLSNGAEFIMDAQRDPAAINIYLLKEVDNWSSPFGLVGTYYTPANNWIVATKGVLQTPDYFMPHEIGHYFSLLHTFHGWDATFDANYPGWPQAPATIFGYPVELMDGSNCTEAGDLICDTPPDYLFVELNCAPYAGGALDPNGTPVDPMENNMMSYYFDCAAYQFTPGQFATMNADLASPAQASLDLGFTPAATEIFTPPNLLISPPQDFFFPSNTNIQLDWLDVAGATHYLVELDIVPSFTTPASLEFIATESELLISNPILPNKDYYWRVRPFNAHVGCATAMTGEFRSGPATSNVQTLADGSAIQATPNPVAAGQMLRIQADMKTSALLQLRGFDAAGRLVWQERRQLTAGEQSWEIPADRFSPGLNWLQFEAGGQVLVQEIVRQ
ncbi:MAG: hypothetical protein JNL02_07255 [Saprospiraceae bacterium]|nr:hypothetical protein [Saprospiraceae bacterium]